MKDDDKTKKKAYKKKNEKRRLDIKKGTSNRRHTFYNIINERKEHLTEDTHLITI